MAENEEVERCKWDMDVVITILKTETKTICTGPTDYMTEKEVEQAAEYIATHGVWWFEVLVPPHRIESVTVHRTGEEKNVYQR